MLNSKKSLCPGSKHVHAANKGMKLLFWGKVSKISIIAKNKNIVYVGNKSWTGHRTHRKFMKYEVSSNFMWNIGIVIMQLNSAFKPGLLWNMQLFPELTQFQSNPKNCIPSNKIFCITILQS